MPLFDRALALDADPQSARRARQWVSEILTDVGRDDLVDSATLGVSELVTNALLHAEPPITVKVRGTRNHPRVEVQDNSHVAPRPNVEMTEEEFLLSTIGRGLGIVALYSSTWGSEVGEEGKVVWFEPAQEPPEDADLSGDVFDLDETVTERIQQLGSVENQLTIRLLDMPVQLFASFRRRYSELRRELRLLALAHGEDYPVAQDLSELAIQVEQERRLAAGVERLDAAIDAGLERVDLEYHVPASAPESMLRMHALLEQADQFCRDQRLLTLAATPQQRELLRWYVGEFQRQAAGEAPSSWTGSFTVEDPGELRR
jgi:anti-sigma regulatory factor (Ser/Thr protein kinase)